MPFGTAPMGRRSGAPVLTEVQGTALALGESSWVRTIDRVVYRLLAVVLTLVLAGWLAQFAARVVEFPPWAAALLVLGLGLIALAVMGAVGFFAVAVSLIALVSALLAGQYWGMEFQGAPSNPALSFLAMACFVAACQPRRHWWVLAGLVPGVYIVVCGWVTHQPVRAVADVMATVPSGAIWWIMLTWLRDTAQEGDERRRAEMRARVEMAIARSEPSSEEEIRRFLHDELIAALATVAYADRIDGGEAAARAGCAAALAALEAEDDTPRGEGLDEASLRSLASEQGLDVEFSIEPGLDPTSINADILVQMRAAAAEAFRNVRRHAGTTRVCVDLRRQGGDGLCLDISDRGRGVNEFDQAGFGLLNSIAGRMDDIGGRAQISRAPEGGTTVRLAWEPTTAAALTRARGIAKTRALERPFVLMAGLFVVGQSWLALATLPQSIDRRGLSVALLVVAMSLTVGLAARCGRGPLSPFGLAATFSLLVVLLGLGLWLAGPGALLRYDSWIVGAVAMDLTILAFVSPLRVTFLMGAVASGVVAGATVLDPTISPRDAVLGVVQCLTYPMAGAGTALLLRRMDEAARVSDHEVELWHYERDRRRERALAIEEQLALLLSRVRPFLRGIVDGTLRVADPAVRSQAAILAQESRDDLYLPGVFDADTRSALQRARRRGATVSARLVGHESPRLPVVNHWVREVSAVLSLGADASIAIAGSKGTIVVNERNERHNIEALTLVAARLGADLDATDPRSAILTIDANQEAIP